MAKIKHQNRNRKKDKGQGSSGLSRYKVRKEGIKTGKQQTEIKEMLKDEALNK